MKNKHLFLFVVLIAFLPSCKVKKNLVPENHNSEIKFIDVQGHRGCRGLMPENTIPAFLKAMEIGVTTLELDVVISKDEAIIVSHEPYFNHVFTTLPNGKALTKKNEKNHNIYKLTSDEIKQYDVGQIKNPKYKEQQTLPASKPTLSELVSVVRSYADSLNLALPYFNIEIKRNPEHDGLYNPNAEKFAQILTDRISLLKIKDKTFIQSFDPETLNAVRKIDQTIPLVLLVGNRKSAKHNFSQLDFPPAVYSPYYKLVNKKLQNLCSAKGVQLIPWTVNERKEMEKLILMGVDGIISDYPDLLIKVVKDIEGYEIKQ